MPRGCTTNFKDEKLLALIGQFYQRNKLLAAISSGPMVLCKAGVTQGHRFLAGVSKEWFLQDENMRLTEQQMEGLIDVEDTQARAADGQPELYVLRDKNLLTAYGWRFREWAVAFAEALGLEGYARSFGLER